MAECIERKAAIKAIQRQRGPNNSVAQNRLLALAVHDVLQIAAADVAPVRHGRWALNKKYGDYECSECGQGDVKAMDFTNLKMRYCPNCGAKMDGAE